MNLKPNELDEVNKEIRHYRYQLKRCAVGSREYFAAQLEKYLKIRAELKG